MSRARTTWVERKKIWRLCWRGYSARGAAKSRFLTNAIRTRITSALKQVSVCGHKACPNGCDVLFLSLIAQYFSPKPLKLHGKTFCLQRAFILPPSSLAERRFGAAPWPSTPNSPSRVHVAPWTSRPGRPGWPRFPQPSHISRAQPSPASSAPSKRWVTLCLDARPYIRTPLDSLPPPPPTGRGLPPTAHRVVPRRRAPPPGPPPRPALGQVRLYASYHINTVVFTLPNSFPSHVDIPLPLAGRFD